MAHDMQEKKDVALKMLVPGEPGEREYIAQNKILGCVQERSHLVTYLDTFHVKGVLETEHRVLVLPLIGPNLEHVLDIEKDRSGLSVSTFTTMCMSAAKQLLVALKDLHEGGIVHGGKAQLFSSKGDDRLWVIQI
jgi:serine/threonine protein kinase